MTFNQGGTYTGYGVAPGSDPGQGTEYGVWQREPGSQNYSRRAVGYAYTAEGDFDGRVEATDTLHLTSANSFESSNTIQIFDADGNLIFTARWNALNNPGLRPLTNNGLARSTPNSIRLKSEPEG